MGNITRSTSTGGNIVTDDALKVSKAFFIPSGSEPTLNDFTSQPGMLFTGFTTASNGRLYHFNGTSWDAIAKLSEAGGGGGSVTIVNNLNQTTPGSALDAVQGKELNDSKQPVSDNLTAISALSPANDDFIQQKAGALTNRTVAQVKADLTPAIIQKAFVQTNGNNSTAAVGDPARPFLTVDSALDACGNNNCVIWCGLGTFASPTYTKIGDNVKIVGEGKPDYNFTVTGGASYPLYTKTTATSLIGGTIFNGEFRWPAASTNIQAIDFGVDCGPAWCAASNGGVASEGFIMANGDGVNTPQNGKELRKNVRCQNIATLVKDPTSSVHSFVIENCFNPVCINISTYNGFAGFVSKNIGGMFSNIKSYNSGDYNIIIKQDSYAYSYETTLDGFEIDGGAGLAIHDSTGSSIGIRGIKVTNGKIRNSTYGVKQIGTLIDRMTMDGVDVINCTGKAFEFTAISNSRICNCTASIAASGFTVTGISSRIESNGAYNNTGSGFILNGTSSSFPLLVSDNDSVNNGSKGYDYTGTIFGNTNSSYGNASANTGTITNTESANVTAPLSLSAAPGSFTAILTLENTGTAGQGDKNVAVFAGNRGSTSNIDDNTCIGLRQKSSTVDNYGVFNFWNSGFNNCASFGTRFKSHGIPQGELFFATAAGGGSGPVERMRIKSSGVVQLLNVTSYADNAAALAAGLVAGDLYKTSGAIKIVE